MQRGFFESLSLLLNGPPELVGEGFKWKQLILMGAVVGTLFSPIFTYQNSLSYQGSIPPVAPVLEGTATLSSGFESTGFKHKQYIYIHMNRGATYRVQDGNVLLPGISTLSETTTPPMQVRGFLLDNGKGDFWPISIMDSMGKEILSEEKSRNSLAINRNPFGRLLLDLYIFVSPFWIVSLVNLFRLINK
jgi:hypothetical protein